MLKWKITCLALLVCFVAGAQSQDDVSYTARVQRYIRQYKGLAIAEQKRSGIPAAITLGQGILETQAGTSELVTGANNHFGIKCKKDWTGETFAHTDDAPNECFRKYPKAEDSYRDHSDYLKTSARYAALFKLSQTDYAGWAVGLKRCGYATNPRYAQQLIKIIEDFKLQEYTYVAMDNDADYEHDGTATSAPGTRNKPVMDEDDPVLVRAKLQAPSSPAVAAAAVAPAPKPVVAAPPPARVTNTYNNVPPRQPAQAMKPQAPPVDERAETQQIQATNKVLDDAKPVYVNGLKAVYAFKGELPFQYALKFNIRYEHLLDMNDLPDAPLASNMFIYLEKKSVKGPRPYHTVAAGETMAQVSQTEGVQLRRLMAMNHLEQGEEPAAGSQLYLQDNAPAKPMLASGAAMNQPNTNRLAAAPAGNYIDKSTISRGNPQLDADNDPPAPKARPMPVASVTPKPVPANNPPVVSKPAAPKPAVNNTNVAGNNPAPATPTTIQGLKTRTTPAAATRPAQTTALANNAPAVATPAAATRPAVTVNKPLLDPPPPAPTPIAKMYDEPVKMPPPVAKPADPSVPEEDAKQIVYEPGTVVSKPVDEPKKTTPVVASKPIEAPKRAAPAVASKPIEAPKPAAPAVVVKPIEAPKAVATPAAPVVASKPAEEPKKIETPPAAKPVEEPKKIETPVVTKPVEDPKPVAETKPAVIEKPVEAKPVNPPVEEEPMDDLARLKARLDRVVYMNDRKVASANKQNNTGTPTASSDAGKFYTVREGDTAFTIAKDNNISMKQLMDWNDLDFDQIKPGQKLRVKE